MVTKEFFDTISGEIYAATYGLILKGTTGRKHDELMKVYKETSGEIFRGFPEGISVGINRRNRWNNYR